MARATRRRRRISFNKDVICCGELVMVVDKKVVYFSRCVTISRSCVLVVDNTVDGKDNMRRRPWIRDIMMYHLS